MSLNTILATTPLTSTNYVLKANGTTIGNSLIWDNGTNVGIGNTNTSYTLDVSGSLRTSNSAYFGMTIGGVGIATTNLIYASLNIKASGTALYNGIALYSTNGTETFLGIGNSGTECGLYATYGANGSYIPITFSTGGSERLRITTAGNVGIGTSSPSKLFTVVASADGQTAGISGASYGIRFDNGGTFGFGGSTIHGVDNTLTATYQILALSGSQLLFTTVGTERMRITSGGKVMVNTTDSGVNALLYASASSSEPYPLGSKALTSSQGLVGFFDSANGLQGSISISGSTVSYNSFMGSH